jgi:hypothetical protein
MKQKETSLASWTKYRIEPPQDITCPLQCWGCDPGTKRVGIAVIPYVNDKSYIDIYEIAMPRWKNAVDRIINWQSVLAEMPLIITGNARMVIEGAAYGTGYREAELSEIRASTVLWAYRLGMGTKIVPPNTIRKGVFGTAKVKAHEVWELPEGLAPNALAALSCAYYASECWGDK